MNEVWNDISETYFAIIEAEAQEIEINACNIEPTHRFCVTSSGRRFLGWWRDMTCGFK